MAARRRMHWRRGGAACTVVATRHASSGDAASHANRHNEWEPADAHGSESTLRPDVARFLPKRWNPSAPSSWTARTHHAKARKSAIG
eukprot:6174953-Pleurochrysis_carterae.AAC.2